jgi:hypothetical protein
MEESFCYRTGINDDGDKKSVLFKGRTVVVLDND